MEKFYENLENFTKLTNSYFQFGLFLLIPVLTICFSIIIKYLFQAPKFEDRALKVSFGVQSPSISFKSKLKKKGTNSNNKSQNNIEQIKQHNLQNHVKKQYELKYIDVPNVLKKTLNQTFTGVNHNIAKSNKKNEKITKKSQTINNVNKNQIVNEDDGWQTVQSRTDKKNRKTEHDTSLTVQSNLITFLNGKMSNDKMQTENKKYNSPENLIPQQILTDPFNLENNQNFKNIQKNKDKSSGKQGVLNNSIPLHMTSEELKDFVQYRENNINNLKNSNSTDLKKIETQLLINNEKIDIINSSFNRVITDQEVSILNQVPKNGNVKQTNSEKCSKNSITFIEEEKLSTVTFDELADEWIESKAQKKNKRRLRKE